MSSPVVSVSGSVAAAVTSPTLSLEGTVAASLRGATSLTLLSDGVVTMSAADMLSLYGGAGSIAITSPSAVQITASNTAPVLVSGRGGVSLSTPAYLDLDAGIIRGSATATSFSANTFMDLTANDFIKLKASVTSLRGETSLLLTSAGAVSVGSAGTLLLESDASVSLMSQGLQGMIDLSSGNALVGSAPSVSIVASSLQLLASSHAALSVTSGPLSLLAEDVSVIANPLGTGNVLISSPNLVSLRSADVALTAITNLGLFAPYGPASLTSGGDLLLRSDAGGIAVTGATSVGISAPGITAVGGSLSVYSSTSLAAVAQGSVSLRSQTNMLSLTALDAVQLSSETAGVDVTGRYRARLMATDGAVSVSSGVAAVDILAGTSVDIAGHGISLTRADAHRRCRRGWVTFCLLSLSLYPLIHRRRRV